MIRVGVIGYGYWGPNIVRNLHGLDSTRVEMVCDKSSAALARVRKAYPGIHTCFGSERNPAFAGHRRRGGDHAGLDALRTGQGGPGKRQARFHREAIYFEFRSRPKNSSSWRRERI